MLPRNGFNAGHLIGLLMGICVIVILVCLFILTKNFWLDIVGVADLEGLVKIGG